MTNRFFHAFVCFSLCPGVSGSPLEVRAPTVCLVYVVRCLYMISFIEPPLPLPRFAPASTFFISHTKKPLSALLHQKCVRTDMYACISTQQYRGSSLKINISKESAQHHESCMVDCLQRKVTRETERVKKRRQKRDDNNERSYLREERTAHTKSVRKTDQGVAKCRVCREDPSAIQASHRRVRGTLYTGGKQGTHRMSTPSLEKRLHAG